MNSGKVSFGESPKRNYILTERNGTPVDKDKADKVVKRNMEIASVGALPAAGLATTLLITRSKRAIISAVAICGTLAGIGAILFPSQYAYFKSKKDIQPEKFYGRWGGYKVVEKPKTDYYF